jgi:phosphomannomutase
MVTLAALAGLQSVGSTPLDVGIVPVPTLQFFVRQEKLSGGICITASHNPEAWNALKFFGRGGIVLGPNQFAEVTDLYHQGVYPRVGNKDIPEIVCNASIFEDHERALLELVDVERIRARKLKVAVDCCNGAAYRVAPRFLEALGCQLTPIFVDPEAHFPRDPEPSASNIEDLCRAVVEAGADVGFALDPDADRLALVDELGHPLGEDCTIALAAEHVLSQQTGPVVVNQSTSRMIEDVAAKYGCPVFRTPVGEIHVVERMQIEGAVVGGEGNGGVVLPRLQPCRDSFVGMALLLELLATRGTRLSQIRDQIPRYCLIKEKLNCRPRDIAPFLRLLRHLYRDEDLEISDGVKIRWPDRWLHVRGSSTEPVLRVVAEAHTKSAAQELVAGVIDYFRPLATGK